MEMRRYQELRLLEAAGQIHNLAIHPKYCLVDGYHRRAGEWVKPIYYIPDFEYREIDTHELVIEDVKGTKTVETALFKLKRKLFEQKYGYELRVVQA
jgi:hypothetical protein